MISMEILTTAKGGTRITRLMADVGVSYSMLRKYLSGLEKLGAIESDGGIWKTT